MKTKNYSQQWISKEDISAVSTALRSPFLTGGPTVSLFEEKLAEYVGAAHCSAFNSATSALHAACLALGVNSNSLVWTSSISFVASANCAKYCGASVDFVDIDPDTFVLSESKLEAKLKKAKAVNALPDVIVVVHLAGFSANMKEIHRLANIYGFKIIEDASHALSAKYENKKVGSCVYSDVCIFSFHPVKVITTLEGGVATTNDYGLHCKLKLLASHHTEVNNNLNCEPWEYQQTGLGYNFRMNDVQAALGISQLERIQEFKNKRLEIVENYSKSLDTGKIKIQNLACSYVSAYHLFIINLTGQQTKYRRRKLYDSLLSAGYKTNVHYIPIHTQPYYSEIGCYDELENSMNYYGSALSLPLFPTLNKKDVKMICKITNENA